MIKRHSSAVHASVIVSTYEWPRALDVVLSALFEQSDREFDVVVADDGSGPETRAVVDRWRHRFAGRLQHIWQPDEGYRLAAARNRGAVAARGDYLVFLDGDCIPRRHFVTALRSLATAGWFVAGRRLRLSPALTERVLSGDADVHRWSRARLLLGAGRNVSGVRALTPRDRRLVGRAGLPDFEPETRSYGFFLAVFRSDFERVDGYDMRYVGWGEEDVDLAVRLRRLGLRCGHGGQRMTLLHLWHPRRLTRERPNWPLLQETRKSDRIVAVRGLRESRSRAGVPNQ